MNYYTKSFDIKYPTKAHESAASAVVDYFKGREFIKAVLLTNSCARNRATKDSCLDMEIVLAPGLDTDKKSEIIKNWLEYKDKESLFDQLTKVGLKSEVEVDFTDAVFNPSAYYHGFTTGPDKYELEIGNTFIYSWLLWQADSYFQELKNSWLPYYNDELRNKRLWNIVAFFNNNVSQIEYLLMKDFHIECMRRIQNAFGEFLQALFMSRKTYPIAYDKHIKEQIVEILGENGLYEELKSVFEIRKMEADVILEKKELLADLMKRYVIRDNIHYSLTDNKNDDNGKNLTCRYDDEMGGIIACIKVNISSEDIDEFTDYIRSVIEQKTLGKRFSMLLDGRGYFPKSVAVQKKYSDFIRTDGIISSHCRAAAYVHHNAEHINDLKSEQTNFKGFFTDINEAYLWLRERKNL